MSDQDLRDQARIDADRLSYFASDPALLAAITRVPRRHRPEAVKAWTNLTTAAALAGSTLRRVSASPTVPGGTPQPRDEHGHFVKTKRTEENGS